MTAEDEERVREVIRAIPPGRVASYGLVAREAGLGQRARFVGRVLSRLPEGSDVPWHRVLRADGRVAFAPGSGRHRRQLAKLAREGVTVAGGRVDLGRHGWRATLDELLWGAGDRE